MINKKFKPCPKCKTTGYMCKQRCMDNPDRCITCGWQGDWEQEAIKIMSNNLWIDVNNILPNDGKLVLCYISDIAFIAYHISGEGWYTPTCSWSFDNVTFWQPLPTK